MIYKVAICDDEINQCAVLEKVIIEYFKNRAEKCEVEVWYDSMSLCRDIKEFNPQILFWILSYRVIMGFMQENI